MGVAYSFPFNVNIFYAPLGLTVSQSRRIEFGIFLNFPFHDIIGDIINRHSSVWNDRAGNTNLMTLLSCTTLICKSQRKMHKD